MNSGSEVSCSLCSLPIKKTGQLNTCAFMTTIQPLYCTAGVCIIGHFMMAIFAHVVDIYTLTTPGLVTFHLPQNLQQKYAASFIY